MDNEVELSRRSSPDFIIKPEENQNVTHHLGRLESITSACILDESIFQLIILGNIKQLPNQDHAYHMRYDRRHQNPSPEFINSDIIESHKDALYRQQYIKFQNDLHFIQNILQDTSDSLRTQNSYQCLMKHLEDYYKKYNEERDVLDAQVKNKIKLEELKSTLMEEKLQGFVKIETYSKLLGTLKDQLEDFLVESEVKTRYIINWQNAKKDQNSIMLSSQEKQFLKTIRENEMKYDREMRIHAEIQAFIEEAITDLENQIESWVDKYNQEVNKRDAEIEELNKKHTAQLHKFQELSKLFEAHKTEINDYLESKEQKRRDAELLEKQNKTATRIQAWWKGTMVRRGLGPYSKKKGKDKNLKKKGKKSNS